MIKVRVAISDGDVVGAEIGLGQWMVSDKNFADFVDTYEPPESFTTLGGTVAVVSDWRSPDPFARAETFRYVAEAWLEQEYGPILQPFTVDIDGVDADDDESLPADTVF